jgi:hypothetical protein
MKNKKKIGISQKKNHHQMKKIGVDTEVKGKEIIKKK